jgi:hypothetical protein
MTVSHPDREEWAKLLTGRVSRGENRRLVHGLLSAFRVRREPPDGAQEPALRRPARRPAPASPSPSYDAAFDNSARDLDERTGVLCAEWAELAETMRCLLALSPEVGMAAVRTQRRFQSWPLCERLIEECHQAVYAGATGAQELADLAVTVAEELPDGYYGSELAHDMRARAWAAVGEVLRVTSDQWRTAEAHRLLDDAIATYRRSRDLHLVGRAYLHKGRLYGQVHDLATAILWLQKGLALIEPRRESGMELAARHGLMLLLHESGRNHEAWFMLRASKGEFASHGGELLALRLQWLEGKLLRALGSTREAEGPLVAARAGFVRQGIGFDAALVSLDLASLYAALGRAAEMRSLAEEMLPIFKSRDLHREAVAALILFQQSVHMETLSSKLLQELGIYLRRARHDHHLRFEYPA